MNQLATVIQSHSLSGTAAEVVAALGVEVVLSTDSTPFTWAGVIDKLALAGIDGPTIDNFVSALPTLPGGVGLNASLMSGGVDFSLETIQAGLDAASELLGPLASILKEIGVRRGPLWQRLGLPGLPSEAETVEALEQLKTLEWAQGMWAGIVQPALDEGKTIKEIAALIAGSVP